MSKRLYRSKEDRIIAGVCGGIAKYFGVDPVIIRAAFVIAVAFMGMSFWAYPILWLIIPTEGASKSKFQEIIEDAKIVEKK